ncbi:MAG: hypothetical protein M1820_000847 [Bogoriella megaspora]|nr:MAG: hypothetical protein M1820_000847 [Bogoriella megaspora]
MSPQGGTHGYYSPRYAGTPSPRASPKMHARGASQDFNYYSSPRGASYSYPFPQGYHASAQTPPRKTEYVSEPVRSRSTKTKRYQYADGAKRRSSTSKQQYMYNVMVDDGDYAYGEAPPPYEQHYKSQKTDRYAFYGQAPGYTETDPAATAHRSRARRASHGNGRPSPPKQSKPAASQTPRQATEEDARRAGIPAGYSYKNWDPTEEPIMLLGSVFDANSLGKWIYDWTVFHRGPGTPMSEVAGELWLLLIQLAGKVKRAEECMPRVRALENREMVEDFLESGERLWARFGKLLKVCENYMWKAAKKASLDKRNVHMGKNSGCEFVDSIFGRDRQLENTEKLMTSMRLWSMRFDANCEDILRHPQA